MGYGPAFKFGSASAVFDEMRQLDNPQHYRPRARQKRIGIAADPDLPGNEQDDDGGKGEEAGFHRTGSRFNYRVFG